MALVALPYRLRVPEVRSANARAETTEIGETIRSLTSNMYIDVSVSTS